MNKIAIIGAGPAGLTAARELQHHGVSDISIFEADNIVGGISRTVEHKGNRIDIGGHRFFTKDNRISNIWEEILPVQGEESAATDNVMLMRPRQSRIFYRRRFFDYPVTLSVSTMRNLGLKQLFRCGFGYLMARLAPRRETSLEDFYINRFGAPLYHMFFEAYTEKVWGVHPSGLGADWGAQRVKGLSVSAVMHDIFNKLIGRTNASFETSLIDRFLYPKYGPGQLWEKMRDDVVSGGASIEMSTPVSALKIRHKRLEGIVAGGVERPCDVLFSSMPIKDLIAAIDDPEMPDMVREVAAGLPYRDFITVGILINRPCQLTDNWIYVQERDIRAGRLQIFNNWSPAMVADSESTTWIGMEYFCNEGDSLWNMPEEDFCRMAVAELEKMGFCSCKDVIDTMLVKMPKAYPAYYGTYSQLETVRNYLDSIENLFAIGRNGQHRYNNMDHSMATAIEAVRLYQNGIKDRSSLWSVNTDNNYHESINRHK